mmetsp:Transcript_2901/g.10508  ORF Transcript_2901/g.10508 Transcript_2901/m.10508 type:complete len:324 (+) Transcript_2901:216-1187(+)
MVVAVDTALCQSHHSTDMTLRNRSKGANMGCEGNSHPRSKLHANGVASRSLGKENGFSKHRVVKEATSRNDVFTEAVAAKQESHKTKSQNGEAAGADRRTGFHFRFPSLDLSVSVNRPWNNKRVVFHIGMALLAILFMEHVFLTYPSRCIAACTIAAGHWVVEVGRRKIPSWQRSWDRWTQRIAHPEESRKVYSATWYATCLPILACLFQPMVALVALSVLGFGDPAASFIGRRYGRLKVCGNKSLEGSLGFFCASFLPALALQQIYYGCSLSLMEAWPVVAAASVGGLLAETFNGPLGLDDNFLIPCSSAAMATAVMFLRGS